MVHSAVGSCCSWSGWRWGCLPTHCCLSHTVISHLLPVWQGGCCDPACSQDDTGCSNEFYKIQLIAGINQIKCQSIIVYI